MSLRLDATKTPTPPATVVFPALVPMTGDSTKQDLHKRIAEQKSLIMIALAYLKCGQPLAARLVLEKALP